MVDTSQTKSEIIRSVKFNIVGFKHRGADMSFLENVNGINIQFLPEPENEYDPNAVKCIFEGYHFGYIEKHNAAEVQKLIKNSINFVIKVISFDEYKMLLSVDFKFLQKHKLANSSINSLKAIPGIYSITFSLNGTEFMYVGQSVNVKSRILQHQSQLESLTHQNDYLQQAWGENSQSFEYKILETVPVGLNELQQQIFLFQREVYWIENCFLASANKISGDLVLTKESKLELSLIKKSMKTKFNNYRKFKLHQKEMLGKLIIELGIIDIWVGRVPPEDMIKPTNVLTWLNKTRYGYLDRRPRIDKKHVLYEKLHSALRLLQGKVANISIEKRFLEAFPEGIRKKRSKFETIDQKSLSKFLNILEKYDQIRTFHEDDFQQKNVLGSATKYDISLTKILDSKTLATLNKGIPLKKVEQKQVPTPRDNKEPWWKSFLK